MTFDQHEAEQFLSEPHVGVFAVEAISGPPAAVPLWYSYAPGAEVLLITAPESRKARLLHRSGRATLVVQTVQPRTRYVSVELELLRSQPATDADVRAMASRYVPAEALEGYLEFAAANLREDLYRFNPTKWRFADFTV